MTNSIVSVALLAANWSNCEGRNFVLISAHYETKISARFQQNRILIYLSRLYLHFDCPLCGTLRTNHGIFSLLSFYRTQVSEIIVWWVFPLQCHENSVGVSKLRPFYYFHRSSHFSSNLIKSTIFDNFAVCEIFSSLLIDAILSFSIFFITSQFCGKRMLCGSKQGPNQRPKKMSNRGLAQKWWFFAGLFCLWDSTSLRNFSDVILDYMHRLINQNM